jgi:hypothetical protein
MNEKTSDCDFLYNLKKYYKYQEDICYKSKLFDDIHEHGSKVLMLFAEIYSFMVDKYGINNMPFVISEYQNSKIFRTWFWKVKHKLGQEVGADPSFCDIGKWIGKGLFLKICLSMIYHNHLLTDEKIIKMLVEKQKSLILDIIRDNSFKKNGKKAIEFVNGGYFLLNEKIILSKESTDFFQENIIK